MKVIGTYILAALSGACFVSGLHLLTIDGRRRSHV